MSIKQLIESINSSDAVSVRMLFDKLMAQKLAEALEDKKIEVAESIFNESDEESLEDFSLEEIEAFMQTEEFEALDELSKDTLGKYIKRASNDRVKRTTREHELDTKNDQLSNAMHNIDDKDARNAIHTARQSVWKQKQANDDKHEKRRDGIHKAVKRLTK
jgi:DNA-binding protein YbaB